MLEMVLSIVVNLLAEMLGGLGTIAGNIVNKHLESLVEQLGY